MDILLLALLAVMPALVIVGGLKDLTSMTIPNWISGLLIIAFFPAAFAVGLPVSTVAVHVGVALAVLVIGAGMFALRWIGGGDAKLLAASCLWMGLTGSGMFILYTAVLGGLLCFVLIVLREHVGPYLLRAPGWVTVLMEPKGDIPYGVAIAAGALMAFPGSALFLAWQAG